MLRLTLYGGFSLADADGAEIPLKSKKAKALLAYLALPLGKARSREEIMALLWSDRAEAQARGSLRQMLSGLRKDLGGGVLRIDNNAVALDPGQITVAEASGREFLAGFQLNDPAFEDWLRDERLRLEDAVPAAALSDPALLENPSIAVLPFENISRDPDQDFFSDGITHDIITELSRFNRLFIIAPRTTFQFKDKALSAQEVGRELEAHYIVEGSVRRAGERVRITAQLIEVETETQLWADRYDRDLTDVFAIQEEVAREIAAAVPGKIESEAYGRVLRRSGQGLTAYEYVLRGEHERDKAYGSPEAVRFFEKAIAADPMCARAYANLALWYAYQVYLPFASFEDIQARVRELGDKALEIEPNDPVNLAALANGYLMIGDFDLCRQCASKAIRTNPNHYVVMGFAALALAWLGDIEAAQEWLELYALHDPLSSTASAEIYFEIYYLAERFDDAIAVMARLKDLLPDISSELAAAYAQAGRLEEARELRQRFEAQAPRGLTFEHRKNAILRTCARERERELWREGYRKAGFPV
jgi:TolB-like protein